MTARTSTATWNREDRDLLVELRTTMGTMREEIMAARVEIKEINTGITARLLNLEGNAVSKLEVNPILDEHDKRLTSLEDGQIAYKARVEARMSFMGWINAFVALVLTIIGLALSIHFH